MSTIRKHFELLPHPNIPEGNKEFLCGIECEIESVKANAGATLSGIFMIEADHSLRNNGLEYKSYPNSKKKTIDSFTQLHKTITVGPEPFSERTSIHVHVNMSELEMSQVKQFVLAYALLEPLFFAFAGEKRQNNIFCVPLFYTYLPSLYKKDINQLHEAWHKYTAFNIKPLGYSNSGPALGTIEFRHLYGTSDVKILDTWLSILEEFYLYFANKEVNILKMMANGSTAEEFAKEFVPTLVQYLGNVDINAMCEQTMLDVALASGGLTK